MRGHQLEKCRMFTVNKHTYSNNGNIPAKCDDKSHISNDLNNNDGDVSSDDDDTNKHNNNNTTR